MKKNDPEFFVLFHIIQFLLKNWQRMTAIIMKIENRIISTPAIEEVINYCLGI